MDEEPHPRHDEQHHAGERIDQIRQVDGEITAENPPIRDDFVRRSTVDDIGKDADGGKERQTDGPPRQTVSPLMGPQIPAEDAVGDHGKQWEHRDELDQEIGHAWPTLKTLNMAHVFTT
jgi:hypothetical protein